MTRAIIIAGILVTWICFLVLGGRVAIALNVVALTVPVMLGMRVTMWALSRVHLLIEVCYKFAGSWLAELRQWSLHIQHSKPCPDCTEAWLCRKHAEESRG